MPFFALKFMAKYPHVKLYKESELGWLSDERGLPYWTYDAPLLMRDAKWLQFWAGAMIRTVGGGEVSVIDIRPASALNQGHIASAVNVPVDTFKTAFRNPATLADVLGPAGVDSLHEAVLVSGAGFTKDAALAFVALEKLGQKKVSILMDATDGWSARGLKVTTETTSVSGKPSYSGEPRPGIVAADWKASRGAYPKVFIASGASVPAHVPDGTVIHVPYTDLIGADGTPKPAKDIWKILSKAGVLRYAELVCFSDDPAEAAATYVVLKLMGFPDIKVLVM